MQTIEVYNKGQLSWHDAEKTILHLTIQPGWTWDEATKAILALNHQISTVDHNVYSVFEFQPGAGEVPRERMLPNLRWMLGEAMPNEKMVVMINAATILGVSLGIITDVYRYLASNAAKVRHVNNLDAALQLIAQDKQQTP